MLFICILTTRFCNFVSADLRKKLRVTFVNAQGLNEPGIDGGGVFREFLSEVLKTGFDPNRGYFCTTPDGQLYPNPQVRNYRAFCLVDARCDKGTAPPPHCKQLQNFSHAICKTESNIFLLLQNTLYPDISVCTPFQYEHLLVTKSIRAIRITE